LDMLESILRRLLVWNPVIGRCEYDKGVFVSKKSWMLRAVKEGPKNSSGVGATFSERTPTAAVAG
jgi:hypothetical protein